MYSILNEHPHAIYSTVCDWLAKVADQKGHTFRQFETVEETEEWLKNNHPHTYELFANFTASYREYQLNVLAGGNRDELMRLFAEFDSRRLMLVADLEK